MKASFTVTLICLLLMVGCLEIKNSVFDTETDLSKSWNLKHFKIPNYNVPGGDVVRFALFADSHQNYQDLDLTINDINQSEADFAIHLGDFTNIGSRDEYEIFHAFLRDLQIPSWIVAGNHDFATLQQKLYTRIFGPENYAITTSFAKFIFFNSNSLEIRPRSADLNWLQQEVQTASGTEPVFIFQHQDPFNGLTFSAAEQTQMTNILTSRSDIFVFHGHLHNFNRATVGSTEIFQISRVEGRNWGYVELDSSGLRVYYCSKRSCEKIYD